MMCVSPQEKGGASKCADHQLEAPASDFFRATEVTAIMTISHVNACHLVYSNDASRERRAD